MRVLLSNRIWTCGSFASRRRRRLAPLWGCALLVLLSACRPPADTAAKKTPEGVDKTVKRGPLSVHLKTDRREMTLADRFTLTLEAEAPETYDIELPAFGAKLEKFLIKDAVTRDPVLLDGGRVRLSRTYTLEPVVSGEYTIAPMTVHFTEKDKPKGKKHDLETPEITITVTSLLPKDVAALDVEDILPPENLPPPSRTWLWITLAVLLAGGILAGLVLRRRRGGGEARIPRRPAHEIAYEALRELVAEDLVAQGRIKEFYRRISTILRVYIEDRFDLHAPERTTEEFLQELGQDETLEPRQKELLKDFLTHCDLVKFAEMIPGEEQIQATFDTTKAFIEETRADKNATVKGDGES